jgi:tRNA A-37 threonylcarbamoyl transferase component Bud32
VSHPAALEAEWDALTAQSVKDGPPDDIWRVNRAAQPSDPAQGWKLHVSATILSAPKLLARAAPVLQASGVRFKVPSSLLVLKRLNCGLFYGYTQIGKALTIYPRSSGEATELATALHQASRGVPGPAVPFERRCFQGSTVFRRYGSYEALLTEGAEPRPAIRRPDGSLEEDRRDANPEWAPEDPFPPLAAPPPRRLAHSYRAYEAISQRGKGGVYRAIDVRSGVRQCIVKEGRHHGEVDWDGTDGRGRTEHEGDVLRRLGAGGVPVPEVLATFREHGNAYLVLESIRGLTLEAIAIRRTRKLPIADALEFGRQCAVVLSRIHELGWVWRDCKPTNLLVENGRLRPLDFEGAVAFGSEPHLPWGSAGFIPQEWRIADAGRHLVLPSHDLYALGAVLHSIVTGRSPGPLGPLRPVGTYRRGVPRMARGLIASLLDEDPTRRPGANDAAAVLARVA